MSTLGLARPPFRNLVRGGIERRESTDAQVGAQVRLIWSVAK